MTTLPVGATLPALLDHLDRASNAVLIAPPGAGKTTAVAPALLDRPWCAGEIILLSPRRIAARAAAERIATMRGEAVGGTVGYATRLDTKRGATTRLTVMTEAIYRNRLIADPELAGVSAVLFDEVHERSVDSDMALAFTLDTQGGLRPDLRVIAMSATLDGARFADLLDAPMFESEGRAWPLTLHHVGRGDGAIEDAMARIIRRALASDAGDLLAFLPGVAEIARVAERLAGIEAAIHLLHGQVDPAAQRAALAPDKARKVSLATSIAETSLTIPGVRIVVDSGLARRARYDRGAGVTRLTTERVSQAAATQRAGRAAREGPGVAWRLWEAAATTGLPPYDPPAILEADLSGLTLDCAIWGVADPRTLRWLDPPPDAALAEAQERLRSIGAVDSDGRATPHGHAVAAVPLPPRLAHMIVAARDPVLATQVAMLLTERALGGPGIDLSVRLARWGDDRGARATAARAAASRLARHGRATGADTIGAIVARAFPDRVARRRDSQGGDWISAGGRAYRLDPADPLARAQWLAVADTQGTAAAARIMAAAPIDEEGALATGAVATSETVSVTDDGRIAGRRTRRLGAITLATTPFDVPHAAARDAIAAAIRADPAARLPIAEATRAAIARLQYSGLSDDPVRDHLDAIVAAVQSHGSLRGFSDAMLARALIDAQDWPTRQALDRAAPPRLDTPAGSSHTIDYAAPGGPAVTVRVQALFGLTRHPMAGTTPIVLHLTSPAGRPIQTTRDLPGFWTGSWAAVAKEMRGRYPRHHWPDDPAVATATLRTKKAGNR